MQSSIANSLLFYQINHDGNLTSSTVSRYPLFETLCKTNQCAHKVVALQQTKDIPTFDQIINKLNIRKKLPSSTDEVEDRLSLRIKHLEALKSAGYHISDFTGWWGKSPKHHIGQSEIETLTLNKVNADGTNESFTIRLTSTIGLHSQLKHLKLDDQDNSQNIGIKVEPRQHKFQRHTISNESFILQYNVNTKCVVKNYNINHQSLTSQLNGSSWCEKATSWQQQIKTFFGDAPTDANAQYGRKLRGLIQKFNIYKGETTKIDQDHPLYKAFGAQQASRVKSSDGSWTIVDSQATLDASQTGLEGDALIKAQVEQCFSINMNNDQNEKYSLNAIANEFLKDEPHLCSPDVIMAAMGLNEYEKQQVLKLIATKSPKRAEYVNEQVNNSEYEIPLSNLSDYDVVTIGQYLGKAYNEKKQFDDEKLSEFLNKIDPAKLACLFNTSSFLDRKMKLQLKSKCNEHIPEKFKSALDMGKIKPFLLFQPEECEPYPDNQTLTFGLRSEDLPRAI